MNNDIEHEGKILYIDINNVIGIDAKQVAELKFDLYYREGYGK